MELFMGTTLLVQAALSAPLPGGDKSIQCPLLVDQLSCHIETHDLVWLCMEVKRSCIYLHPNSGPTLPKKTPKRTRKRTQSFPICLPGLDVSLVLL